VITHFAARTILLAGAVAFGACGKSAGSGATNGSAAGGSAVSAGSSAASGSGAANKPPPSTSGTFAHTLADYLAKQTPGVPCPVVGVGQELKVGEWTVRVDTVTVHEPESKLPWIKNVDERGWFAGKDRTALAVKYSVRNDTPVKKPRDLWVEIHTSDGEVPHGAPYNEEMLAKANGIPTVHGSYAPSTFMPNLDVRAAKIGATDDGAMWVRYSVSQIDPNDRSGRHKIEVIKAQGVIDLGKAAAGPPINPKK
jgi:hypothetical protein